MVAYFIQFLFPIINPITVIKIDVQHKRTYQSHHVVCKARSHKSNGEAWTRLQVHQSTCFITASNENQEEEGWMNSENENLLKNKGRWRLSINVHASYSVISRSL